MIEPKTENPTNSSPNSRLNSPVDSENQMVIGYVPCENTEQAKSIAKFLLEKELIACANIIHPMTSLYLWQGQLEESHESILIIKTLKKAWNSAEQAILELHSYDCPCVISWATDTVNSDFNKWITRQVSGEKPASV